MKKFIIFDTLDSSVIVFTLISPLTSLGVSEITQQIVTSKQSNVFPKVIRQQLLDIFQNNDQPFEK